MGNHKSFAFNKTTGKFIADSRRSDLRDRRNVNVFFPGNFRVVCEYMNEKIGWCHDEIDEKDINVAEMTFFWRDLLVKIPEKYSYSFKGIKN